MNKITVRIISVLSAPRELKRLKPTSTSSDLKKRMYHHKNH
ncbi:hypothetical protein [Vibrio gallaecicus]|nr:hypothetical protein [Vibrio gallaecicus]MDN3615729.1 hypothetical protein [Vibrio gallaecicus]